MAPAAVLTLATFLLAACATAEQRRAAENAEVKKQATEEIARICALKGAEREAAIEKLKRESGYELHCAPEK